MTPDSSVLVAAFAPWHEHHGKRLISCDRRAGPIYDQLGVPADFL